MLFYLIAGLVVVIDQVSKYLIRTYVQIGETVTYWHLNLTHYENSGMARSMFQGYSRLFAVIAVVFVIGVLYYRRAWKLKGKWMEIGLAFLVGGAVGNGIDRTLFGQVTDFLISRSGRGILNLADHAINIGLLFVIIHGCIRFLQSKLPGSRVEE